MLDAKAREEILKAVNVPFDAKGAQRIKPKHHREIAAQILGAFSEGKISKEEALPIYRVLNQENLVAWEDEFAQFLDEFRRDQSRKALLTSLETLYQKYKIGPRERTRPRAVNPEDLEVVCYMFPEQRRRQGNGPRSVESNSLR